PTRKDQAAALIELLLRRNSRCFISFYNALVKEAYDDLAKLLYADLPDVSRDGRKSSAESSISSDCFPQGVHWLSIGQLDKPDLLVKVQSLCFRLEQSLDSQSHHRPPTSLDEAKERLRFLMLRRYPR
ncbi:hypothetical protein GOODEAATRI_003819, partial [Goodea atripinnis]